VGIYEGIAYQRHSVDSLNARVAHGSGCIFLPAFRIVAYYWNAFSCRPNWKTCRVFLLCALCLFSEYLKYVKFRN